MRAFDESRIAAALGVDEAEEGVLALATLGPAAAATPLRWQPAPWTAGAALGVTDAIHRASSLRPLAVGESPAGATAPPAATSAHAGALHQLPAAQRHSVGVLDSIARRRSQRRYSTAAFPQPTLSALLEAMVRRQAPLLSDAVRVHVVTHAVEGLPEAAWRYDAAAHALRASRAPGPTRGPSRRAALDQDVCGDAAALFVLTIDRAASPPTPQVQRAATAMPSSKPA